MAKKGRPSRFTQALADTICERLAGGESLNAICKDDGFPSEAAVRLWVIDDREGFAAKYGRAREAQADTLFDEILSIADDGSNDTYIDDEGRTRTDNDVVQRSRLRVDARKWMAGKLRPKVYGDKVMQEVSGPDGGPMDLRVQQDADKFTSALLGLAARNSPPKTSGSD